MLSVSLGRAAVRAGIANSNDPATDVADALANVMHYCDARGIDFDGALDRARDYHADETAKAP